VAQDLEQLQERRTKLQEQIDEVDTKIYEFKKIRRDELMAELKELGLEDMPKMKTAASSGGTKRQRDPNKPCPVCGETGHDARRHRGENIKKKKAS
jgi:DNA repair exonuclease SbcCD ATPase subunit